MRKTPARLKAGTGTSRDPLRDRFDGADALGPEPVEPREPQSGFVAGPIRAPEDHPLATLDEEGVEDAEVSFFELGRRIRNAAN